MQCSRKIPSTPTAFAARLFHAKRNGDGTDLECKGFVRIVTAFRKGLQHCTSSAPLEMPQYSNRQSRECWLAFVSTPPEVFDTYNREAALRAYYGYASIIRRVPDHAEGLLSLRPLFNIELKCSYIAFMFSGRCGSRTNTGT